MGIWVSSFHPVLLGTFLVYISWCPRKCVSMIIMYLAVEMPGHTACACTTLQNDNTKLVSKVGASVSPPYQQYVRDHSNRCLLRRLLLHNFSMFDNQMGIRWNLLAICIPWLLMELSVSPNLMPYIFLSQLLSESIIKHLWDYLIKAHRQACFLYHCTLYNRHKVEPLCMCCMNKCMNSCVNETIRLVFRL